MRRLGGRGASVPCVIVLLKRLPRSFLSLHVTGATVWGRGWGQGGSVPSLVSKVLHLCEGVGWEGISGAIEVEDAP